MLGKLVFADKNSIDSDSFFEAIRIVGDKGGVISRYHFYREMEVFLNGKTSLPLKKPKGYREASRNPYNKTKAPRSYGFMICETIGDEMWLKLTPRGMNLYRLLDLRRPTPSLPGKNLPKFTSLIIDSLVYQTFGKNNNGLESTNTDIDPPKIVLKAMMDLKWLLSEDSVFLVYGLQNRHYPSFAEAVGYLIELRSKYPNIDDYKDALRSILENWSINDPELKDQTAYNLSSGAEKPYPLINLANDNKLLRGLKLFNILYISDESKKVYRLVNETFRKNRDNLRNTTPVCHPLQLLISGVPGTGKSFFIKNRVLGFICDESRIVRTTIHRDYSSADFIGFLSPKRAAGHLRYEFKPGAFTIALERALLRPNEDIYLVIEELNRGNMSAIMGDTVQLLDRVDDFSSDDHGKSVYAIRNPEIAKYLRSVGINDKEINSDLIRLPSNFNIIATMNTADQNVYLMDSFLRRRFQNYYLPISFDEADDEDSYLHYINELSKANVFGNKEGHSWVSFAKHINSLIDMENDDAAFISEDKKLAPFFVNEEDVSSVQAFCNKVLFYLQSDVFKYSEIIDRRPYEEVYDLIVNKGKDPFEVFEAAF